MIREILATVLFLIASTPAEAADVSKEEKRLFSFGQKALEDHLYELAETQFQNLLSQFPQSQFREEAAWLLARSRLSQGRWRDAVDLIEARLPTTSHEWQDRYFFCMGEAQLKGEMAEAAYKTYETLIARFPGSPYAQEAKHGMARALLQQQKFEPAQELLRAVQKDGKRDLAARASLSLGLAFFLQKKYDQAQEVFSRLSKEEDNKAIGFQALLALGDMELERKQINAARSRFETLTKSDRPEAQAVVTSAFLRLGQIEAAATNWVAASSNYEQAFRKSDDPSFRLQCAEELTEVYLKLDKADTSALETWAGKLKGWSEENPKTRLGEALLLEACTAWQRAGKRDQAIRAFLFFLEKYPNGQINDRAHFQLGWVFLENKNYESAAAEFQKAAERARSPQLQADAWLKLGDLGFERQQFDAAASAYLKCAQIKGADASKAEQALYQAAYSQLKAGNSAEVFKLQSVHDAQYAAGKLGAEFLLLAAEASRRAGDLSKVADACKELLEKHPNSSYAPKTWLDYAEALHALSKFKEATVAVNAFLEKYPNHELIPRALLVRAYSLERMDQTDKALAEFEAVVKNHPQSAAALDAHFWLGLYFDRQKNHAKAQEQFELLRKKDPKHPRAAEATFFAARAAYRLGQNKKDVRRLIESLAKDYPKSPWVFDGNLLWGDILTEGKEFKDALLIFEDLIRDYDPAKAPQMAERILEAQGRRGQCLRQLKRYEDASAAFKTILDSPKADASLRNEAYVELGKTCENMGDINQALENYLAPLYSKEGREFFWVCKGGFEAVDILRLQKDWAAAARVLKRLIESNPSCRKEAEEKLKKLQAEHPDAN
ncbi:MAG: tetratricopeptide repeat protein [Verrucomicrobia bacterium]|nr:tetratricopeptide repeat protein [Verrucomicrobiota bacterium]